MFLPLISALGATHEDPPCCHYWKYVFGVRLPDSLVIPKQLFRWIFPGFGIPEQLNADPDLLGSTQLFVGHRGQEPSSGRTMRVIPNMPGIATLCHCWILQPSFPFRQTSYSICTFRLVLFHTCS